VDAREDYPPMMKAYKYKLNPNKAQRYALARTLDVCRELYNMGLEQRKFQRIGENEQKRQLTEVRAEYANEYRNVHVHVLQNVLKKLDRSFQNTWKLGFGYPRFKSESRYNSFSFNNVGFKLNGKFLSLSKIGNVKVRLSRNLPADALVKGCTVKRTPSGWFATLMFEYRPVPLPVSNDAVGVDMGIENFAALSNGTMIPNPRFYECGQPELRVAQRRVSRRSNKGSHRRARAVALLRKTHERIANRRLDFLHKTTTSLIRQFGVIAVENLNVKGLSQGILSKQIHDASWSMFFNLLAYKAESAGRILVGVDCKYTSQTCPACGRKKKKKLSERAHSCECGYSTHRDTAAAQVILGRAVPLSAKIGETIHV
jgi:putative transposase